MSISSSKENEEDISDILYSIGADSLEIQDPNDLIDLANKKDKWDFFAIDIKDLDLDKLIIKSYFSEEEDIEVILKDLRGKIEEKSLGSIETREIEDEDYLNNWKKYFKPFKIGENIIIKPSWEDYEEKEKDIIIDIDPGMAFGTGTHETTSLCVEALEEHVEKGDTVFDIGCGSGILSIVSSKLGAKNILAIDLDPASVRIAKENILKNRLEDKIQVKQGDLLDVVEGKADIIVANIIAEVILLMTDNIGDYLKTGGKFIASGIILDKKNGVLDSLRENNFTIEEIKIQGEWVSIVSIKN